MITHLQREIQQLKNKLLELSADVERSLTFAAKALIELDPVMAEEAIRQDREINSNEVDIEEEALKILALYQPVASDLRMVITVLKVNTELERIGDLASAIARYVLEINRLGKVAVPAGFSAMCNAVQDMTRQATDSFLNSDVNQAAALVRMDADIDKMNVDLITEIKQLIRGDQQHLDSYMFLFSCTRSLERVGDYCTNIAEEVYFLITGQIIRHNTQNLSLSAGGKKAK